MNNLMILVAAIALAITAVNSQAQDSESKPTTHCQITNVQSEYQNLIIEGTVRNTDDAPIDSMSVKAIGYNRRHEIIGTGFDAPVIGFSLEHGQIIHFRTEIFNQTGQDIASYTINVDARFPIAWPTPSVVSARPAPLATPYPANYYITASPTPISNRTPTLTPTPGPATLTLVPMTKEQSDKLEQERIAEEQAKRKVFEKKEAEREARGDFSQAPGLTPEQREAAEVRWSEKEAADSIKGAKPFPQ